MGQPGAGAGLVQHWGLGKAKAFSCGQQKQRKTEEDRLFIAHLSWGPWWVWSGVCVPESQKPHTS